jgi:hypothetical protein
MEYLENGEPSHLFAISNDKGSTYHFYHTGTDLLLLLLYYVLIAPFLFSLSDLLFFTIRMFSNENLSSTRHIHSQPPPMLGLLI